MKVITRFTIPVIVLLVVGLTVSLAISLKNAAGENLTGKLGLDQHLGASLPLDAKLKDETGKTVKLGDYFGKKPVVLMLIFYSCQGSCNLELEGATKSFDDMKQNNIGRDYDVVSISIHPKETYLLAAQKKADILETYKRPGSAAGWHFLTGDQDQVRRVADAIGYRYSYNEKKNQVVHPTGLFVATPEGRLSRYYFGVDYPSRVLRDSIVAAGRSEIGVKTEPILFGCFQYDANTGKTRLNVFNALKVSGFATVIILAASIFLMSRKPKENKEDGV